MCFYERVLLEIDGSGALLLAGALDDFMSCLQPLSMSTLLRRMRALPSDTLPLPSATDFTYQTHDSASPLKHSYQRLH